MSKQTKDAQAITKVSPGEIRQNPKSAISEVKVMAKPVIQLLVLSGSFRGRRIALAIALNRISQTHLQAP